MLVRWVLLALLLLVCCSLKSSESVRLPIPNAQCETSLNNVPYLSGIYQLVNSPTGRLITIESMMGFRFRYRGQMFTDQGFGRWTEGTNHGFFSSVSFGGVRYLSVPFTYNPMDGSLTLSNVAPEYSIWRPLVSHSGVYAERSGLRWKIVLTRLSQRNYSIRICALNGRSAQGLLFPHIGTQYGNIGYLQFSPGGGIVGFWMFNLNRLDFANGDIFTRDFSTDFNC